MPAQKHKPEEVTGQLYEVEIVLGGVDEWVDVEAVFQSTLPFERKSKSGRFERDEVAYFKKLLPTQAANGGHHRIALAALNQAFGPSAARHDNFYDSGETAAKLT